MCGIAGILGSNQPKGNWDVLGSMLNSISHRGPDYAASWSDDSIILGHNRLSIIDLNVNAAQPMVNSNGRYVVVFNGEIYNYRELRTQYFKDYFFSTHSDTEVLLASYEKWGKEMLPYLNGMFAFAIWDTKERRLFAARDRFGVKPFYYSLNGQFLFASEIKALWAGGVAKYPNWSVWAKYFSYGSYGLPDETFWKDIYQLPAGHILEIDYNLTDVDINPKITRWYNFIANVKAIPEMSENEFTESYKALLGNSIQLRFRSDVPVGFNVSGGLDSSTLLALINQEFGRNGIEAFSFYTGNPAYDELPWVRDLLSITDNPLNAVRLDVDEVPELAIKVGIAQDEPYGGLPTLAYSKIFKTAREKGIIVLLDGQGMDEAWGGYDYYYNNSGFTIQGTKSSPLRPEIFLPEFIQLAVKEKYPKPFDDEMKNLQYRDLFFTKIPRALRFNDRISMMHSTELREPFLDYRLVELAFAQTSERKYRDNQTKYLLRVISKKVLGNKIALAPKRPLQTPQREWLGDELREWVNGYIHIFAKYDFVNKRKLEEVWSDYLRGDNDNSFYIWQWLSFLHIYKLDKF